MKEGFAVSIALLAVIDPQPSAEEGDADKTTPRIFVNADFPTAAGPS